VPASFASTDFNFDQLVASETISRGGTMTSGEGVVKRGTIVGLNSTSGKFTKTDPATGIVAEDCDATSADAPCVVYVQGKFLVTGVIWPAAGSHASHTALLHDLGVYLLSVHNEAGQLIKPNTATVGLTEPLSEPVPPPPAAVTLNPTQALAVLAAGESGSIAVTSPGAGTWKPTTADAWITIDSPTTDTTGDGTVNYTVAANTETTPRSGSIAIGDQSFSVAQLGA